MKTATTNLVASAAAIIVAIAFGIVVTAGIDTLTRPAATLAAPSTQAVNGASVLAGEPRTGPRTVREVRKVRTVREARKAGDPR